MKNISITAFINTIFIIAFMAILTTFWLFNSWDKERYIIYEKQRYTVMADAFLSGLQFSPTKKQLEELYKYFNVESLYKEEDRLDIVNNAKLLYVKESSFGRVRIFVTKKAKYIYVQNYGYNLMLKDKKPKKHNQAIALFLLGLISSIMIFIYVTLMGKLLPLRRLNREVKAFGDGNLDIEIKNYGNDEIGKIAKSFDYAIKSIKQHINSKNLFMRNMMHELKTPITKGRIVVETLEDAEDREILIRAFERMNEIITELAQVEKITSRNVKHCIERVKFSKIVEGAKALLLDQDEFIIEEYEDFEVQADVRLLTVAVKNLLDNGIKFSKDQRVIIQANINKIDIISQSEPLKEPLEYYIEPFSQGEKKAHGYGLGLYIVKSILDIHHYRFTYKYYNQKSIFSIILINSDKTMVNEK
jgi:two-component system OmpR family sensor kinase